MTKEQYIANRILGDNQLTKQIKERVRRNSREMDGVYYSMPIGLLSPWKQKGELNLLLVYNKKEMYLGVTDNSSISFKIPMTKTP